MTTLNARDQATYEAPNYAPLPVVVAEAEGSWVTDVDGNVFCDFAAGIAVASTGHAHPRVVAAIKDQAERLIHIAATDFYEPRYLEFSERLAAIAPFGEPAGVFLTNSGTEAVEGGPVGRLRKLQDRHAFAKASATRARLADGRSAKAEGIACSRPGRPSSPCSTPPRRSESWRWASPC